MTDRFLHFNSGQRRAFIGAIYKLKPDILPSRMLLYLLVLQEICNIPFGYIFCWSDTAYCAEATHDIKYYDAKFGVSDENKRLVEEYRGQVEGVVNHFEDIEPLRLLIAGFAAFTEGFVKETSLQYSDLVHGLDGLDKFRPGGKLEENTNA